MKSTTRGAMTSKERIHTVFAREIPDRVPIYYLANPGIDGRLKAHFGLAPDDHEGLLRALKVDIRAVFAPYTGPKLHKDIPERKVFVNDWGTHLRYVEHETGGYMDYCDFPLEHADEETIANWPMPNPDHFDYGDIAAQCKRHGDFAVYVGNAGLGDIINSNGMLRGMEQALIDLITDDPAGLLLAKRRTDINAKILYRTLEAAKGGVDFVWMGEDLGTQIAPMISLETYRKNVRPFHEKIVGVARSFGVPILMHSCGSSSWAYDDYIEMGITAVESIQPEAKDMDPKYLKKKYGDRLSLWGCISTAGPVATGSVQDTIDYCKKTLANMMPDGGYAFGPSHELQDNSPTENVVAMYKTAWAWRDRITE